MGKIVYIVEDDESIKELESYALVNSGFEVEGFESSKEFYDKIDKKIPDLIVLDIMLPEEDGIQILRKIRNNQNYKDIPVIMVTAKTTEIDAVKALDLGADDYINKPFGIMEFISRINAVLRRINKESQSNVMCYKEITLDDSKHRVYADNVLIELTFKEYEILKYLMINRDIVLSRDKIMENIWGYDFDAGNRTVDVHIQSLRKKLDKFGNYIKTIRNVGYKLGD